MSKVKEFDEKTQERLANLVKLANDDEKSEESRNAAIQVAKMMREHQLVLIPASEIERVRRMVEGANELARQQRSEKMQNMALGAVAGVLLAKQFKF